MKCVNYLSRSDYLKIKNAPIKLKEKYKRKKTETDGIMFDSAKEAKRYSTLKLMEKAGIISNLELQKKFVLIPAQKKNGKVIERACTYTADFCYMQDGQYVVEDCKGMRTEVYKIKKKLMLYTYGIEIQES